MLRTVRPWQHVVVGLSILAMTLLTGFRVIGAGDESVWRPEHFDAKQVTVWPADDEGVRIREVVDIDFGPAERRGYQRIIPNDFGVPADVTATSPDANAALSVVPIGYDTRIRIGDPNVTFTGRHRYVLEYTLPDANLASGVLALDIIGTDETFETERFEVVLTGFDFDGVECDTGSYGSFGGCEFDRDDVGNQVAVIEPLRPGDGISVGGRFGATTEPHVPDLPVQPDPVPTGFAALGLVMIPLGVAAAAVVFFAGRRYGANTVLAGGATEAAFGELPVPGEGARAADVATYRVPDARLAELATIEFAPPRGLDPWQAAAVLRETVGNDTVLAWFSEMVANDAIVVDGAGKDLRLRRGTGAARLNSVDQGHLTRLFGSGNTVELGTYDPAFTATWNAIAKSQREFVRTAGWWSRGGPAPAMAGARVGAIFAIMFAGVIVAVGAMFVVVALGNAWRALASPGVAIVLGIVVPFAFALLAYRRMFASRTATGSALALRSESFRRFLASSEGKHVDWAWEHGLLREYSAWAVALGAADAWSAAIRSSHLPDPTTALAGPLLMHSQSSSFAATRTAPSSSGSGGGGGGGGVGGGGGGGSSGSW